MTVFVPLALAFGLFISVGTLLYVTITGISIPLPEHLHIIMFIMALFFLLAYVFDLCKFLSPLAITRKLLLYWGVWSAALGTVFWARLLSSYGFVFLIAVGAVLIGLVIIGAVRGGKYERKGDILK